MPIVVARIAPEPIVLGTAVTQYRARGDEYYAKSSRTLVAGDPLPPILTPVPEPVPAPAILPPSQAFAAALIIERMPQRPASLAEIRLRMPGGWQAPGSSLRLADRRV
jgi:hypothetical protein